MNKKILVLAASTYQVETIKTAKRLGYYVVTTDNVAENPGHKLADKSYNIDTTDKQAVLEIAKIENIDGIIAPCTDVAVPTVAYVAQHLSIKGTSLECANIVTDKVRFREFLKSNGFPMPEYFPINSSTKLDKRLFDEGLWIMKPARSSGCKGIFIILSESDFYCHLPETISLGSSDEGILERFIEGYQGTCEGILKNGELVVSVIMDRQTVDKPFATTCGHHVPTLIPEPLQNKLYNVLQRIWKMLGVKDGPFDCDFIATEDEVYIIELSPRIGGNSIPTLLKKACGFDLVRYSITHACDDEDSLPSEYSIKPSAVVLLGVSKEGSLSYNIQELESLKKERWVDMLSMDVEFGAHVKPFSNGRHRVGETIVYGKDRDDVDAKVLELKGRLSLEVM